MPCTPANYVYSKYIVVSIVLKCIILQDNVNEAHWAMGNFNEKQLELSCITQECEAEKRYIENTKKNKIEHYCICVGYIQYDTMDQYWTQNAL